MGLITWESKGARLTSDEMDNNLYYLENLASDYFTSATESQEINIANSRVQSININSDTNFICEDASIGSYKLLLNHYDRANITFGDNIDIEYTKPDYETISYNIIDGFNSSIYAVVKQPDGKILVGGEFTTYRTKSCYNLVRFNIDGSLDETFNSKLGN